MPLRVLKRYLSHQHSWWFIFVIATVIAIAIGALRIGVVRSFNLVVGSLFVLFFPGWWVSFIAFPVNDSLSDEAGVSSRRSLDIIERCTLAVALSIIISSLTVFVLYNFPGNSKLVPKNFIVATALLAILLFAAATWRKRWIHITSVLILGVFPFVVFALNQVFNIAITVRNLIGELLVLFLVLIVVKIIARKRSLVISK